MLAMSTFCYHRPIRPMAQPYHHGNLRPALLQAALDLIRHAGPATLTLREVARRAGVSHNAPYRHFRDKEALLAAVAAQGFDELRESMLAEAARESEPLARLRASGSGYVAFALRRPEHFQVMFDAPCAKESHPEAAAAGDRTFHALLTLVGASQLSRQLPGGDPLPLALRCWALVHGIAKLAVAGRLPFADRDAVLAFARETIAAFLPYSESELHVISSEEKG